MNSRDWMMRAAAVAMAWALAPQAQALTAPSEWTDNCAGCHGSGRPLQVLPTLTGSENWGDAIKFKAYVNAKGVAMSSPPPATPHPMAEMTTAEANAIWPYLTKRVFGALSQTESFSDDSGGPISHSIGFGSVEVFSSAAAGFAERVVTLTNTHGTTLDYAITGITTNTSDAFFVSDGTCTIGSTANLTSGASCTFTIRFKPRSGVSQSYSDTVNILTRDLNRTISLTGSGQERRLQVATSTLTVSAAANSSNTATRVLTNNGQLAVGITGITVSGTAFSQDASTTCGATLNAGSSCNLVVRFAPTAEASYPGSVSITHSGTNTASPTGFTLDGTGTSAPVLNTNVLGNHPDTVINTQSSKTLTLSNDGVGTLNISGVATSGADASRFARNGGTCGATLAQGASCTIIVTFSPTAIRSYSASLDISSDASNGSPRSIALAGAGIAVPAPIVSLTGHVSNAVNFGTQTVGGLYPSRTLTLSNTGNAALAITSLSSNSARHGVSHNCGSSLAASASCTITLSYSPNTAGATDNATLSLVSNAAGSPHTIALSGQAVAFAVPVLSVSPSSTASFGTVNTGQVSATQTFTVSNAGLGGAQLNLVHLVGTQATQFGITGASTCTASAMLYEGESCTVVVQFNPAMPGNLRAQLEVTASTNGSLITTAPLTLQGEALGGPTAILELSQTALRFDATRVGNTSATDNVEVWNKGSGPMVVSNASVSGPYWVETGDCGTMPFQLAPGQHCTLKVGFKPDASGMREGALSITSTAANSVSTTLSGEGQAPMSTSGGGAGSLSWGWLAGLAALVAARRWRASLALPLVAGALALGSAPDAQAQFDAEVHGIVDYSYGRFEPSGLYRTYRVNSNSLSPSFVGGSVRYGFDGGYTVGLNLETFLRFQDLKGGRSDDDPMLSRNNFLLANTPYGNMRFGRLQSYLFDTTTRFNAFGNSVPFSPAMRQTFAGGNLMGLQGDFYWNRAFSYTSPNLEGFTVNVMQSKGEKKDPASLTGVNVVWQRGVFSAALSGQQVYLNNGIDDPTNEKVWQLGVSYNLGFARLFGLHTRTNDLGLMVHSRSTSAGLRLPLGPGDVIAQAAFGKARGVAIERLQQTLSVGYIFPWDSEIDLYVLGMDDRVRDQTRGASVAAGVRWRFQ